MPSGDLPQPEQTPILDFQVPEYRNRFAASAFTASMDEQAIFGGRGVAWSPFGKHADFLRILAGSAQKIPGDAYGECQQSGRKEHLAKSLTVKHR